MPARPKYKAVPVFWNTELCSVLDSRNLEIYRVKGKLKLPEHIWRFDSQHEFKTYLELCRMYGENRIIRQLPVSILKPSYCYPRGKTWKVDFAISDNSQPNKPLLFVEAKGAFLTEFALILGILEELRFNIFRRLRIVFPEKLPVENKMVKTLLESDFKKNLLTLKELGKLKILR